MLLRRIADVLIGGGSLQRADKLKAQDYMEIESKDSSIAAQ